jgi:hypothetical protein
MRQRRISPLRSFSSGNSDGILPALSSLRDIPLGKNLTPVPSSGATPRRQGESWRKTTGHGRCGKFSGSPFENRTPTFAGRQFRLKNDPASLYRAMPDWFVFALASYSAANNSHRRPLHSALEFCTLSYNRFELLLDKMAEITYL